MVARDRGSSASKSSAVGNWLAYGVVMNSSVRHSHPSRYFLCMNVQMSIGTFRLVLPFTCLSRPLVPLCIN